MIARPLFHLLLLFTLCASVYGRTWTDRQGREIDGEFVELKDDFIHIRVEDRDQVYAFPFERLSAVDQNFVRRQLGLEVPKAAVVEEREEVAAQAAAPEDAVATASEDRAGDAGKENEGQASAAGSPMESPTAELVMPFGVAEKPELTDGIDGPLWFYIEHEAGTDEAGNENRAAITRVKTSKDLEAWTTVFEGGLVDDFSKVRTGNMMREFAGGAGAFIMSGVGDNFFITRDGENWSQPEGLDGQEPTNIIFGGGLFIGTLNNRIVRSWDGIHWERQDVARLEFGKGRGARNIRAVTYGEGKFVFVGERRRSVFNGEDWIHHEVAPEEAALEFTGMRVLFANGQFLLTSNGNVEVSDDGISWEPVDVSQYLAENHGRISSVTDGSYFYLYFLGPQATLIRSKDGKTWENLGRPAVYNLKDGGPGMLLGMHSDGWKLSRDGGESWTVLNVASRGGRLFYYDGERLW